MLITEELKAKEYYQALVDRNESYIGTFYAGVKTTSIFCIATCRARKPKEENVEFFTTFKAALDNGYRPCKICRPTENAYQAPEYIEKAITLVKQFPKEKITDQRLREHNISPENTRRWFNKHYGITFHAFQRMYRVNSAYHELKKGKKTTDTAFNTAYESLSGFGYTYKKILGQSPQKSVQRNIILINRMTTPLGPMFACATDKGLCLLEFVDRRMLETEFKDLQRLLNATIMVGENEHIIQARHELAQYFNHQRQTFSVSLDTPGTDFQRSVWKALINIPFGQTRSYQEQASTMGQPKAIRAVASANGLNRIAIIIPCHRVIGKDGHLRGYGGGLERKRWLLSHEQSSIREK
jgi:AraC family transcriptional regulator of adaptative response/methylated-DNA-[protein]-cysteine methyltransferase